MNLRVKVRLAELPNFAWKEYNKDQVNIYSKLTEFIFEALRIPLIREWLEKFAERLNIERVEIRLNRLPHSKAMLLPIELGRRKILKPYGTYGRSSKNKHS